MLKNVRFFLYIVCAICIFTSCGGDTEPTNKVGKDNISANTATLPNHVKYTFYKRNEKARKPQEGDLLTFHFVIQNYEDSILSTTYGKYKDAFKEQPFEGNFFMTKLFFKEIFSMTAEGDSLSFWISEDSLAKQPSDLKTLKTKKGTYRKHTLKMIRIRSKADIKRELREKYSSQNKKDSALIAAYLDDVRKKETRLELQTTPTGLRYYIRKPGKGNIPQEGDTVTVNYTEKSIDGSLYGKSDMPTEFIIGQTMPVGLEEGLALMTEGSSSVFILPSELGYGEHPPHENIPRNAVLVYEIDMVRLKH